MEIIDNKIKRKFADFSKSQCREQPKQYSYSSKCLIFDDLMNSSKQIKNKGINYTIFLILLNMPSYFGVLLIV